MNTSERSFMASLWDFFCSLKLTVITLILLATTSIVGTVIRQDRPPQEYIQAYGETTYQFLNSLQVFDMYHSWWFLALLGLFSINLTACSIKRFPRVLKAVNEPVLVADDTLFRTFSNTEEHITKASVSETSERMKAFLAKKFASAVVTEKDGMLHLFAQKGPYSRFGVYVTHLSILIIFVGAIIGNLWGYKAYVNIVEGTAIDKVWPRGQNEPIQLDFAVRCEDFSVSYYEGGQRPKEFKSILTVLENGQSVDESVTNRPIVVNDPLTYKGITFYQSSYGPAGDPVFRFNVKTKGEGRSLSLTARQGQRVQLPAGGAFRVVDFYPSYDRFGPAAHLQVETPSGQTKSFIALKEYPEFGAQRGDDYTFTFVDYDQKFYTGLQVAKDPGVWVVWVGCFLMVVGTMIAFFMSHRRIWIRIQPLDGKTGIKVGGSAHRNQPAFELFFDDFKADLKNELNS